MDNKRKLLELSLELLENLSYKIAINKSKAIIEPSKADILKEKNKEINSKILDIKQDILSIFDKLNQNANA